MLNKEEEPSEVAPPVPGPVASPRPKKTPPADTKVSLPAPEKQLELFLQTAFSTEARHARRLEQLAAYERTGELPPLPGGRDRGR